MALTKQQIFEAMRSDIIKRKPAPKSQPHKPKADNFADLVTRLKSKEKPVPNPE